MYLPSTVIYCASYNRIIIIQNNYKWWRIIINNYTVCLIIVWWQAQWGGEKLHLDFNTTDPSSNLHFPLLSHYPFSILTVYLLLFTCLPSSLAMIVSPDALRHTNVLSSEWTWHIKLFSSLLSSSLFLSHLLVLSLFFILASISILLTNADDSQKTRDNGQCPIGQS